MISMIKDELETQMSSYKKPKTEEEVPVESPVEKSDDDFAENPVDYSPISEPSDEDYSESDIEDTNTENGSAKNGAYVDSGEYIYKKENGRWQQYRKAGFADKKGKITTKDTYKGIASKDIVSDLEKLWQKQGRKVS